MPATGRLRLHAVVHRKSSHTFGAVASKWIGLANDLRWARCAGIINGRECHVDLIAPKEPTGDRSIDDLGCPSSVLIPIQKLAKRRLQAHRADDIVPQLPTSLNNRTLLRRDIAAHGAESLVNIWSRPSKHIHEPIAVYVISEYYQLRSVVAARLKLHVPVDVVLLVHFLAGREEYANFVVVQINLQQRDDSDTQCGTGMVTRAHHTV